MKAFLTFCIICCVVQVLAAQELQDSPPVRQDYYQIFLDAPIQKVNKVTYSNDSGFIQFKLSPDGQSIQLLDYQGTGGVKAEVVDAAGATREIIKSKCNVHSLQEL